MTKKSALFYLCLSAVLVTFISCSSGDKKDEEVSPDVAEATADVDAPPADEAPADSMASNDQPPADDQAKAPETGEAEVANNAEAPPPEAAATPADGTATADANPPPAAGGDEFGGDAAKDANASGEQPPANPAENPPPPATETASNDTAPPPPDNQSGGDLFGAGAAAGGEAKEEAPPKPKKNLPLAHIKDAPFSKGGQLLNTVYIARDGDTLESVSQKLFNEDKTKLLKKTNPNVKKSVKTGDKIYFNSPNRPDDQERMMTVYEDQGLPPSTYTTKDGDTLKALAQEWYGSEGSYKEIYAINKNLASTKELPAGTELQYWPASVNVAAYGVKKEPEVAQATPPPPPAPTPPTPPPAAGTTAGLPPPPGGGLPPPPAAPDMNAVPPPPPPPPMALKHKKPMEGPGMDKDTIMYAVAGGVLLIGGGALIGIRRRNSRKGQGITQI